MEVLRDKELIKYLDKVIYMCPICKYKYDPTTAKEINYSCCIDSQLKEVSMKEFNVPVVWHSAGTMKIDAYSLEEAIEAVFEDTLLQLPDESLYLEDSIEVDYDNPNFGFYYNYKDKKFNYPKMKEEKK